MEAKTKEIELRVGDAIYYDASLAYAVIIEDLGDSWSYSLRSPPREDLTNYKLSIQSSKKELFTKALEEGRFEYYRGS